MEQKSAFESKERKGSMESYREMTSAYYEKWLGQDGILSRCWKGTEYVYSEQRNMVQYGYGSQFDIYALCQKDRMVVSYGDKAGSRLDRLKSAIRDAMDAEEVRRVIEEIYEHKASHNIKYVFENMGHIPSGARALTEEDYREYEAFWLKNNPGCRDTEWLREYFEEMVQAHMCVGVYADGGIVSCTDAPGMPYMGERAQEIGINTLKEYRGKGYASMACGRCISELIARHKTPLWSASADNPASRRLAEKTGFAEFADVVTVTL